MEQTKLEAEGSPDRLTSPPPGPNYTLEERIGAHRVWLFPPDLVELQIRGDLSAPEMARLGSIFRRLSGELPWMLLSVDITHLGDLPASTRRTAAHQGHLALFAGCVMWGGSFMQRVLATMVWNAVRLLGQSHPMPPVTVVSTQAEAHAFLDTQRARRQA
ncbi:Hypothetical protein CAP_5168 [Chondromyces apiculatus DSM 436]|uniref:STAS/SEC14 domain-containing protein n=1 Tax=Chondromyces apiculatus DSM 436 TaxID=1192034 RepID=A0A017T3C3_9BACT|nr:Hypothetical protein CAP_5168 [Chondromyces apiculatus DSM 436]